MAVVAKFNGKQHFSVTPRTKISTLAEETALRFKTFHSHGALLNIRSKDRQSGLEIFLYASKLFIKITLGGIEHVSQAMHQLHEETVKEFFYMLASLV